MISLKRLRELPFSIKNGGNTSVFHLFKHKKQIENIVVFSKKYLSVKTRTIQKLANQFTSPINGLISIQCELSLKEI